MARCGAASVAETASHVGPSETCVGVGAIAVRDMANDTRSWVIPPHPPEANPLYGDLRAFALRATGAGVCVRWTTAAPAPPGATFVFVARGPYIRGTSEGYGINLQLRKTGAVATYGLDRQDSRTPRIVEVRVGQTGSVVSAFIPLAQLNRPPANNPNRPPFPWKGFTFEARVLTAPDPRGNIRVDVWPQEAHLVLVAGDINGRLCFPCHDPRFT